jgi:hypothetical protein
VVRDSTQVTAPPAVRDGVVPAQIGSLFVERALRAILAVMAGDVCLHDMAITRERLHHSNNCCLRSGVCREGYSHVSKARGKFR